jgi:hypothetical protein
VSVPAAVLPLLVWCQAWHQEQLFELTQEHIRPLIGVIDRLNEVGVEDELSAALAGCARASSGHAAAAPPRSVMNSRRLTLNIGGVLPPWRRRSVYRTLNLPHDGRQVLGTDLNYSESRS